MPRLSGKQIRANKIRAGVHTNPEPKPSFSPTFSKYGYNTTNSPVKHTHSAPSRRPVTLVKISPGKSDDWA